MKFEFSAGGVIVRKKKSLWEVLLIEDMNKSWTFPKGMIEKGEKPAEAAKREVLEEVGLKELTLLKELKGIEYFYKKNGLIKKKVYYFLFQYDGAISPKPQKEEGITDAKWMPIAKAHDMIGYPKTNTLLMQEAQSQLEHIKK